jgi:hypothetical protein
MGLLFPAARTRISFRHFVVSSLLAIPVLVAAVSAQQKGPTGNESSEMKRTPPPGAVEVRFTSGNSVQLLLLEESVPLNTPYGRLVVPINQVHRIELATRIAGDVATRIRGAIKDLGNAKFRLREGASIELLSLREKGYPALQEAVKLKDPEVTRRAEQVLEKIRETVPEEQLEFRKSDLIYTEESKFAGMIEAAILRARTAQGTDIELRLEDIRSIHFLAYEAELEASRVAPDPGDLVHLANEVGKKFAFRVTGTLNGRVWGTDVYTTDSALAAVAVHAGLLRPGQAGVIRVMIVAPHPAFRGTARNGVTSSGYGHYQAFQVLR